MIVRDQTGKEFRGDTAAELVRELHASSHAPCDTDEEFMAEMAERASVVQTSKTVRHGSAEEFISDLLEVGLLTTVS